MILEIILSLTIFNTLSASNSNKESMLAIASKFFSGYYKQTEQDHITNNLFQDWGHELERLNISKQEVANILQLNQINKSCDIQKINVCRLNGGLGQNPARIFLVTKTRSIDLIKEIKIYRLVEFVFNNRTAKIELENAKITSQEVFDKFKKVIDNENDEIKEIAFVETSQLTICITTKFGKHIDFAKDLFKWEKILDNLPKQY